MRGKASAACRFGAAGEYFCLLLTFREATRNYQRETPPLAGNQLCDWRVTCATRHSVAGAKRYSILGGTLCLAEGKRPKRFRQHSMRQYCRTNMLWNNVAMHGYFVSLLPPTL
jgi:hypothetical protein